MHFVAILGSFCAALGFAAAAPPSLILARQQKGHSIAECAPKPWSINNFVAFSGSTTRQPTIAFTLVNSNLGGYPAVGCTTALALGDSVKSDTNYYSCQHPGSAFRWSNDGVLTIYQAMTCDGGDGTAIWAFAQGQVQTITYPLDGGTFYESIIGYTEIPTTAIQVACTSSNGVTCDSTQVVA